MRRPSRKTKMMNNRNPISVPSQLIWAALSVFIATGSALADSRSILGTWQRGDGTARVRMAPCGNKICATNVWIKDAANQQERVGDRLVFTINPIGDAWTGSAYDPQRKLNMSAKIIASGNSMVSTGCMLGGLYCRSTNWARIEITPNQ